MKTMLSSAAYLVLRKTSSDLGTPKDAQYATSFLLEIKLEHIIPDMLNSAYGVFMISFEKRDLPIS